MPDPSGRKSGFEQWNLSQYPPEGHRDVAKYATRLWEEARDEKLGRLGLHTRWDDLHNQFRGKKKRGTSPQVGVNYLFKAIKSFCATLTEKHPQAEVISDNADPMTSKALGEELKDQWNEQEMQSSLYASSINFGVYGTALEKGYFNVKKDIACVKLVDPYCGFPAPGYKMCNMVDLPYFCEIDFWEEYKIRERFGVPENIHIPTSDDESLIGKDRETTTGAKNDSTSGKHYPSHYADSSGESRAERGKCMIVEIWCRDESVESVPITEESPVLDDLGRPIQVQQVQTGAWERPKYPGNIRKITICPALDERFRVLDDSPNPNINLGLVDIQYQDLLTNGMPVEQPILDGMGMPLIDPMTGAPAVQVIMQTVTEEQAYKMAMDGISKTYLFDKFPYSATAAEVDPTQWWGFSYIEALEGLQGAIEMLIEKYFLFLLKQMFPILINPLGSGVEDSELENDIGLIIHPTIAAAPHFRYLDPPSGPRDILEFVNFLLVQFDMVSQSPEVAEGRRPKGVSAASAIVALQDKAATLMIPYIRQVDKLIRNRGRMMISMLQNFGTQEKPIKVEEDEVTLLGIDLQGDFDYLVESGSSAPITKAGRREQYVQLFQLGAMDLESLLQMLEIPKYEQIVERLTEQNTLMGAIDVLVQAGLPQDYAGQLFMYLQQSQGGTGRGAEGQGGPQQQPNQQPQAESSGRVGAPSGGPPAMKEMYSQMRTG